MAARNQDLMAPLSVDDRSTGPHGMAGHMLSVHVPPGSRPV